MFTPNLRGGDVVEHQEQAIGLGVAPPVIPRAHRREEGIIDDAFPIEVGDHELHTGK